MMKEILFGTTNEAKVRQLQGALAPIGVRVRGVADTSSLPPIEEDGKTAQENARKKAIAYATALHTTMLSMDNALYFDALPASEQPGLQVRRIPSSTAKPSDRELLAHYVKLVRRLGERTGGHWEFAICVAAPDGRCEEITVIAPRIFTVTPSLKSIPGYPLESIQIDPASGKYISDMSQEEQDVFWQREIGKPLQDFIKKVQF
ncbi:MAG: hypothetical protein HY369_04160 [Candidatus Aenigmarchaeota archaeon]|nr:hypothetical protein [Candidatus Aenigmarchaeota archaeon]